MKCLVDTSYILHRSAFTFENLSIHIDGKRVLTGSLYGLTKFISQVLTDDPTMELHFCFDSPSFRSKKDTNYKKNRDPDRHKKFVPLGEVFKIVSLIDRCQCYRLDGYEADDLIASKFFEFGDPERTIIYTGDHDFLQLLPFGAKVSNKRKARKFLLLDELFAYKKFEVPASQILLYRGMIGDPSDNLKPVYPRIQKKLVRAFVGVWESSGSFQEALSRVEMSAVWRERLGSKDVQQKLQHNLSMMSLKHYQKSPLTADPLPIQPDYQLLQKYNLSEFREFVGRFRAFSAQ